ncbi:MAG: hypothetical protein ACREBV_04200 [Candidatus Zixiibacteriota bacterium]
MNLQTDFNGDPIELHRILAKPLYFGLVSNVLVPMGLLMLCYYHDKYYGFENKLGDLANPIFYVFLFFGATEGAFAFWWRGKLLAQPMVRSKETFQQDVMSRFLCISRRVFLVIAAISLYGYLYYFLTGRFTEAVFMVLFSFIVFQFVRPRFGAVKKVIEQQHQMAQAGKFDKATSFPMD